MTRRRQRSENTWNITFRGPKIKKTAFPPRVRNFGVDGKCCTSILSFSSKTSANNSAPVVRKICLLDCTPKSDQVNMPTCLGKRNGVVLHTRTSANVSKHQDSDSFGLCLSNLKSIYEDTCYTT